MVINKHDERRYLKVLPSLPEKHNSISNSWYLVREMPTGVAPQWQDPSES